MSDTLDGIVARHARLGDLTLHSGAVLPDVTLCYETYGRLNATGDNVVLLTHGFTGSQHMAGRYAPGGAPPGVAEDAPGSWSLMIGPGRPIDPARFFIVASNMLGGCYGSTGPASINPATGTPWGPDFPAITLKDIVGAQRRLLEGLGVRQLAAVMGSSYGGFQAFTWATTYPDFVRSIVACNTATHGSGREEDVAATIASLARDPNWNGGWYYGNGGIAPTLYEIRLATLRRYGMEEVLAPRFPDPAARAAEIRRLAEAWSRIFDGNTMVTLRRAMVRYDARPEFHRIRAPVLYALTSTDVLFPPAIAPAAMQRLEAAGVAARHFEIRNDRGHLGVNVDSPGWVETLAEVFDRAATAA
ncbi:MAG: alpha/beta fold hydrolase [Acetobacteraceae bacterium]|nr:alpha/beta fold hydrolase [Acetobacteraceae bacterium]